MSRGLHWTPEEDGRLRRMLELDMSIPDIAKALGRIKKGVYRRMARLEIKCPKRSWAPKLQPSLIVVEFDPPIRIPEHDPLLARLREFHG